MPRSVGSRKLVDIVRDGDIRLDGVLETVLRRQSINFEKHCYLGDGFVRYYVNVKDLRAAQSLLPVLRMSADQGTE
jgi:hypothetical protein